MGELIGSQRSSCSALQAGTIVLHSVELGRVEESRVSMMAGRAMRARHVAHHHDSIGLESIPKQIYLDVVENILQYEYTSIRTD